MRRSTCRIVTGTALRLRRARRGLGAERCRATTSLLRIDPKQRYPATIKGLEILPSANLIWSWNDQNNVRLTYARSINRPDFIESANYRYFDDLETGAVIKGNPNVTKASIAHYDLRWEFFPSASEVIALSGFAKDIQNPIEATVESVGTDLVFTFQNQKRALLYGGEIEFRKKLDFITELS
jgi:outer membrane receptor protein involved in Fe transport